MNFNLKFTTFLWRTMISNITFCQANQQKQFIIVCGNITYSSVSGFLADFFHPAREDVNCEVVFLNKMEPDLEFEGLLKREKTRVTYFQVDQVSSSSWSILSW